MCAVRLVRDARRAGVGRPPCLPPLRARADAVGGLNVGAVLLAGVWVEVDVVDREVAAGRGEPYLVSDRAFVGGRLRRKHRAWHPPRTRGDAAGLVDLPLHQDLNIEVSGGRLSLREEADNSEDLWCRDAGAFGYRSIREIKRGCIRRRIEC